MPQEIKIINLTSRLAGVNCYLVRTGDGGYVLIDSGMANQRADLEKELEHAGCIAGTLKLIVITHGDSDHAGNAAYLRDKYGAKIAIHRNESAAVERGNMLLSRKRRPLLARLVLSLFKLGKSDRFKPDLYIEEGDDLTGYGFDARVLDLPGHSSGSIGILTTEGQLFCGDLFINTGRAIANSIVDDAAELEASVKRVKGLAIHTVYPGHGKPFSMEEFIGEQPTAG